MEKYVDAGDNLKMWDQIALHSCPFLRTETMIQHYIRQEELFAFIYFKNIFINSYLKHYYEQS